MKPNPCGLMFELSHCFPIRDNVAVYMLAQASYAFALPGFKPRIKFYYSRMKFQKGDLISQFTSWFSF